MIVYGKGRKKKGVGIAPASSDGVLSIGSPHMFVLSVGHGWGYVDVFKYRAQEAGILGHSNPPL